MLHKTHTDTIEELCRASPQLTVSGFLLLGFDLQQWVLILTAVWLIVQISLALEKRFSKPK